jgi:NAD(P) transhydrogenase subunit alpha
VIEHTTARALPAGLSRAAAWATRSPVSRSEASPANVEPVAAGNSRPNAIPSPALMNVLKVASSWQIVLRGGQRRGAGWVDTAPVAFMARYDAGDATKGVGRMADGFVALYIFMLAAIAGHVIISRVPVILHTPLMSGSNFIHGIVLIGAMVVLGHADTTLEKVIGFVAVLLGAGNAAGGYVVTERMLDMFKSSKPSPQKQSEPKA